MKTIKASSPPCLFTLIGLTAFSTLSLTMFLPSLASIARDFGADYATVSIAVSGYLAVTAVVQLVTGPLSDRIGRRPVILSALALFCAASLMCALAENIWTFLVFRMLQAGVVSGYSLSLAIVRDTTSEERTAGLIGYIGMAMALGPLLAPLLGGSLDTAFGWRASFWLFAASGAALLLLCWIDLGETKILQNAGPATAKTSFLVLLREPLFWAFSLCTAFSRGAFFIFVTGAPLVAQTVFGVSTAELGFYIGSITAGFMAGGFLAGRFAPRTSPTNLMLAGRLVACGGLLLGLAIVGSGFLSPVLYFGSTLGVGLGNGLSIPGSDSGAMSVRPDLSGSAAGFSGAMTVGGGAVLTTLTGFVLPESGGASVLLVLLLGVSTAALFCALWAMQLRRSHDRYSRNRASA